MAPANTPENPCFSSGPCAKHKGFSLEGSLSQALVGRSHRAKVSLERIRKSLDLTRSILQVPEGHRIAIVPASDTGAVEMCLWSMLGPLPVTVAQWDSFGKGWASDLEKELKIQNLTVLNHERYGQMPDLSTIDTRKQDVVFTWNGTTSGVRVPNADWIAPNQEREGLMICDATSAVFAMPVPIEKLDVVTFSWQKVLGGEAGCGMIILSPKAVERLESYTPSWPLPKIFRMTKAGKIDEALFTGSVINTVSMLCVEDYIAALEWAQAAGGLAGLCEKSRANLAQVQGAVDRLEWLTFLAEDPATVSCTSVCLRVTDMSAEQIKSMTAFLDKKGVAHDINNYRDAPPGLRIWCGATVESSDIATCLEWVEFVHDEIMAGKALE